MMQLKCFRSLWSTPTAEKLRVAGEKPRVYGEKLLAYIRKQGYDGIEASLSDLEAIGGISEVQRMLADKDMELIVGLYSGWVDYEDKHLNQQFESVQTHLMRYRLQLETALTSSSTRPMWINVHSGSDHWSKLDQMEFIAHALELENEMDCHQISHETHRGRIFYSPWPTLELLEAFPSLKLTLDFSHWCVVSERLLDTPEDEKWIKRVLPHVHHVHGRIGTSQQAQLTHPTEDFSQHEIERFERLWDQVWKVQHSRLEKALEITSDNNGHDNQKKKKTVPRPFATFTPEYGPIPYAPRHHQDLDVEAYDVDQFCMQQADHQRERFAQVLQQQLK